VNGYWFPLAKPRRPGYYVKGARGRRKRINLQMPRRTFAVFVLVALFSLSAHATIWTNTRPEIAQMAGLWEVDMVQISPLINAQYPNIGGGTSVWQYIFASSSASSDGDLHHAMAIDSSGTGQTGNNVGNAPGIGEIVNSSAYISTVTALSAANNHRVVPRGIFRVYTEHANEIHYEIHPITEELTNSGGTFVVAANMRSSITNDPYARHGYALSTMQTLVDGSITMTAQVLADNNRVVFNYPSGAGGATMNYPEYDGRVVQILTNDVCGPYFTFLPTNSPAGAITGARVMRCRIVTNTHDAPIATGLVSNMAVNVNSLNRMDFLVMSNTVASISANGSLTFVRPVEFVVLGLKTLGTVAPPAANFTGTPTNGIPSLTVTFTDNSTGSITNRAWDFGDGGTSNTTATSVQYAYNAEGTNTVRLIVSGLGGSNTNAKPNYIVVGSGGPPPPVADFSGSPTNGTEPLVVTFTDASTGTITNWFWDFGDTSSTNATTNSVTHTYSAGTNTVTLVVSGPDGDSTNTNPNYITVLTAFQSWQVQYFGSTTDPAAAPDADPDGDGCDNLCEFQAGTDPTNGASFFHITSVTLQGNDVLLTWDTGLGRTNVVQATAGLPDGSYSNNFSDIGPLIVLPAGSGATSTNYFDLGAATNIPSLYYRIRLVP
jgi:PKD repeat protein